MSNHKKLNFQFFFLIQVELQFILVADLKTIPDDLKL